MTTLIGKLCLVPFIAFFAMMISVALIGKDMINQMPWLFPDKNDWIVYVAWLVILTTLVPIQHYLLRKKDD